MHRKNSILINADLIRPLIPDYHFFEWPNTEGAIEFMSKEVGLLCELILWASLEHSTDKHIIFDSTLRHTQWFKGLFQNISECNNNNVTYKIAMIGVLPKSMEQLKSQIIERNRKEYRNTEWEFVENIMDDVNRSLFELKEYVDVAINITNPGSNSEPNEPESVSLGEFDVDIFCRDTDSQSSLKLSDLSALLTSYCK